MIIWRVGGQERGDVRSVSCLCLRARHGNAFGGKTLYIEGREEGREGGRESNNN